MAEYPHYDQQTIITWCDVAILNEAEKTTPWIDILRKMRDGELPMAPSARLFGVEMVSVEPGEVVFSLQPEPQMYNLVKSVFGGIVAGLTDFAAGLAVQSRLAFGTTVTTLEMHLNFVRAVTLENGPVTCTGRVIHFGARTATSEARVVDAKGRLCAHMGTTCMILPLAKEQIPSPK